MYILCGNQCRPPCLHLISFLLFLLFPHTLGTAGVELLTNCMNNYFTRVISLISSFDGDVIKFAGDSMIVAFCPSESEKAAAAAACSQDPGLEDDLGLRAATLRAAQCSHQVRRLKLCLTSPMG